jgi:hypothetical protein
MVYGEHKMYHKKQMYTNVYIVNILRIALLNQDIVQGEALYQGHLNGISWDYLTTNNGNITIKNGDLAKLDG